MLVFTVKNKQTNMEMKVTFDKEKKLGSMKHSNTRKKFYWENRR